MERLGIRWSKPIVVLLVAFVGTLALSSWMASIADLPSRGPTIVDLELSMSPGVFTQIVDFWGEQKRARDFWGVVDVRQSVRLDFIFALAYAFLIDRLYRSLCLTGGVPLRRVVALAPWAAAAFDYFENILLLTMLAHASPPASRLVLAMSVAAIVKFALLAVVSGFTVAALFAGDRGRVIRGARYSVLSLVIGTFPIIALDQGRDLLLGLADPTPTPTAVPHQVWFIVWTVVWALSVWYWSRILLDADAAAHPTTLHRDWSMWLPRVAGVLTLLVPGVACLVAARGARASHDRLMVLFWVFLALSIGFLAYVVLRRRILFAGTSAHGYNVKAVSKPSAIIVALSSALSIGMLIYLTADALDAGQRFGAVAILAIVAANTVFLGAVAVFLTRARSWPIELAAVACVAAFSFWNDNHSVRLIDRPTADPLAPSDMSAAFASWVAQAPGSPGRPVPVVVVAAEGGGIRAAYWTSLVLHHLAADAEPDVRFADRLFAISSVSGGSFGAAVYAGLRRDRDLSAVGLAKVDSAMLDRPTAASAILQERFLAPMVAKLVSGDFLQWFLPFPVRAFDRSSAMETAFGRAYAAHAHRDSMAMAFTDFRPARPADVPVLLLNSTSVELGRRVVASPYPWPLSDVSVEEQDPVDFHALVGRDVSVATAVHNTARFPYISAAGLLRARNGESLGHLVDGGYFENIGADTLIDLLRYLKQSASPLSVRFIAVVLLNTPPEDHLTDPSRIPWRDTASLGEVFSPLRALLQTRTARGDLALRRLRESVEPGDVVEFRVCSDSGLREAPLGWQLSKEMVDVLDASLDQDCFKHQVAKLKEAIRR